MLGNIKAKGKGAVYLRVSTNKQDLNSQKGSVGQWASRQDELTLKREYAEKISGAGGYTRKQLNAMIADARANQFDVAIFNDMSRLGRNVHEAMQIVHEFAAAGVQVAICEIDMVWDLDDPVCNMVAGVLACVAQFESDEGKKRTKRGMVKKDKQLKAGMKAGKLPPGTRIGQPSIVEKYIPDPNAREGKKGLLVAPHPVRADIFKAIWNDEGCVTAYDTLREVMRIPINPECKHKCRKLDDGTVFRSPVARCHCGKKPSRKTIHKTRKALGLEPRNKHSFKRASVKMDKHDIFLADYYAAGMERGKGGDTFRAHPAHQKA